MIFMKSFFDYIRSILRVIGFLTILYYGYIVLTKVVTKMLFGNILYDARLWAVIGMAACFRIFFDKK